jgi:2-hydroxychromene-2-carboxylate isomerase
MGEAEIVAAVLTQHKLDAQALLESSKAPDIKAELIANTEAAVARGVFGAPTFFMGDEMYLGQDRLDFVEEALQA